VLSSALHERPALSGGSPCVAAFIIIRVVAELAGQMLNVAVGWYVYAAIHDPMSLAYVGLAQFAARRYVGSGIAATLFGAMSAALLGEQGTLVIVALWSTIVPELRQADTAGSPPAT
jgi:hypothetical protein